MPHKKSKTRKARSQKKKSKSKKKSFKAFKSKAENFLEGLGGKEKFTKLKIVRKKKPKLRKLRKGESLEEDIQIHHSNSKFGKWRTKREKEIKVFRKHHPKLAKLHDKLGAFENKYGKKAVYGAGNLAKRGAIGIGRGLKHQAKEFVKFQGKEIKRTVLSKRKR